MVKIFVGNVNPKSKSEDLSKIFQEFGTVNECDIVSNFAFVHMDSESAAERAINQLQGVVLDNSKLNIEKSRPKRGGGGGGGQGRRPPPDRGFRDDRRPPGRDRDRRGYEPRNDYYSPSSSSRSAPRYPPEPYGYDRGYSRDAYPPARDPYPAREPPLGPPPTSAYPPRDSHRSAYLARDRSPLARPAYDYDRYYERDEGYPDYPAHNKGPD